MVDYRTCAPGYVYINDVPIDPNRISKIGVMQLQNLIIDGHTFHGWRKWNYVVESASHGELEQSVLFPPERQGSFPEEVKRALEERNILGWVAVNRGQPLCEP